MSFTNATALVVLVAGLVGAWALSLLAHPIGTCPRCRGRRVHPGLFTNRVRPCGVCGGTGLWRRIGATFVHRTYWSLRDDARRRDHLAALEHRAIAPRPVRPAPPATTETSSQVTNPERHDP